jgi:hypothetical protein
MEKAKGNVMAAGNDKNKYDEQVDWLSDSVRGKQIATFGCDFRGVFADRKCFVHQIDAGGRDTSVPFAPVPFDCIIYYADDTISSEAVMKLSKTLNDFGRVLILTERSFSAKIIDVIETRFEIKNTHIFETWVGMVCTKRMPHSEKIDASVLLTVEQIHAPVQIPEEMDIPEQTPENKPERKTEMPESQIQSGMELTVNEMHEIILDESSETVEEPRIEGPSNEDILCAVQELRELFFEGKFPFQQSEPTSLTPTWFERERERLEAELLRQEEAFADILRELNYQLEKKEVEMRKLLEESTSAEILHLRQLYSELMAVYADTLASGSLRLGKRIVETMRNPLKIFLWPVWFVKMTIMLAGKRKQRAKH